MVLSARKPGPLSFRNEIGKILYCGDDPWNMKTKWPNRRGFFGSSEPKKDEPKKKRKNQWWHMEREDKVFVAVSSAVENPKEVKKESMKFPAALL